MLNIALVDDDARELSASRSMAERWRGGACVSAFSSADELLDAMDAGTAFDLYLLDVVMPDMDGIALGRAIRERNQDGAIVYLTTSPDFALESYEVWPLQYLLKPVDENRLFAAMDRVAAHTARRSEGVLVHTRSGDVLLPLGDILYAEKSGRCIRYACRARSVESVTLVGSFREAVEPLLDSGSFVLCGASIAVNLTRLTLVDKTGAVLATGERLELPRAAVATLRSDWMAYCLGERGEA